MKVKNISIADLQTALETVNADHGYKLEFNREPSYTGNFLNFTIKSASKIPGARTSASGRNLAKASWHSHGYLFDAILELAPTAIIKTAFATIDQDKFGNTVGNWEDTNCGSYYAPVMMSETSIL